MKKLILILFVPFANVMANDVLIEISFGAAYANNSKTIESGIINSYPVDKYGWSREAAVGYQLSEDIFSAVHYQYNDMGTHTVKNHFVSINYQWAHDYKPYLGFMMGHSRLSWNQSPIPNAINNDYESDESLLGFQMGGSYPINKQFSVISKIQYYRANHITKLIDTPDLNTLHHNNFLSLSVGVQYKMSGSN